MTKHVYITVTGCCRDKNLPSYSQNCPPGIDGTVAALGEFYQREDGFYILYDEPSDPDSRQHTPVKNIIRLRNSVLELTKKGEITARMVFVPGQRHRTDYVTPWGALLLETETRYLNVNRTEDKIHIEAEYLLSADGFPVNTRFISIKIQNCLQSG